MGLNRGSKIKRTFIAFGVCGLALLAGALATRSSGLHERRQASEVGARESSNGSTVSGSTSEAVVQNSIQTAAFSKVAKTTAGQKKAEERQLAEAWKQSTIRLKYLDRCVQSQSCESFGQQSPDEYYIETRLAQAAELRAFKKIAMEWQATYGGSSLPREALDIANHFLKTGDDYVKEAALELIEKTEPTMSERDAIVKALMDSGSGPLFEKAMQGALLKYKGDAVVDRMLLYQAARGAMKVQTAIAMHSLPYLNAENQGLFEIVASKKNQRALEASYWRANFAEKERMNEGG